MNRVIFYHLRNITNGVIECRGGTTVAVEVDNNDNVVRYATAHCNPHDNYNKKYGRAKAQGRLVSKQHSAEWIGKLPEFKHLLYTNGEL